MGGGQKAMMIMMCFVYPKGSQTQSAPGGWRGAINYDDDDDDNVDDDDENDKDKHKQQHEHDGGGDHCNDDDDNGDDDDDDDVNGKVRWSNQYSHQ